jgi:hypothetical protein
LTCHDPHQPVRLQDDAHYNRRCGKCHNAQRNPPRAACTADSNPGCIGCHMPRVAVSAELEFVNHWIGVYSPGSPLKPLSRTRANQPATRTRAGREKAGR